MMFFGYCAHTLVEITRLSYPVGKKVVEALAAGVPWAQIIAVIFTGMANIITGNVAGVIAAIQALIDALHPTPTPTPPK